MSLISDDLFRVIRHDLCRIISQIPSIFSRNLYRTLKCISLSSARWDTAYVSIERTYTPFLTAFVRYYCARPFITIRGIESSTIPIKYQLDRDFTTIVKLYAVKPRSSCQQIRISVVTFDNTTAAFLAYLFNVLLDNALEMYRQL